MFLHHFASSLKHQKSTITLFSIKQRAEESLRGYVKRFNTAMLEVPAASEEIKISALSQGLREGDLFRSLALDPVATFDRLLERAERDVNLEEAQKIKKEERGAPILDIKGERGSQKDRVAEFQAGELPGKKGGTPFRPVRPIDLCAITHPDDYRAITYVKMAFHLFPNSEEVSSCGRILSTSQ